MHHLDLTAIESSPQTKGEEGNCTDYEAAYKDIQSGVGDVVELFHIGTPFQRGLDYTPLVKGVAR